MPRARAAWDFVSHSPLPCPQETGPCVGLGKPRSLARSPRGLLRSHGIRPELTAWLCVSPSSCAASFPFFAGFSSRHLADSSLTHEFSSQGLLPEAGSEIPGVVAEFASGLRVGWVEAANLTAVMRGCGGYCPAEGRGDSCTPPATSQAPQPALPATPVHPLPASLGGASWCVEDLPLESGGQEGFMASSISTVDLKTNQNPLAYPFLRSQPPCCQMQKRKF